MLQDQDATKWLERMNYACLYVESSLGRRKCGPGKMKWRDDLATLTEEQRDRLQQRIEHFERMLEITKEMAS